MKLGEGILRGETWWIFSTWSNQAVRSTSKVFAKLTLPRTAFSLTYLFGSLDFAGQFSVFCWTLKVLFGFMAENPTYLYLSSGKTTCSCGMFPWELRHWPCKWGWSTNTGRWTVPSAEQTYNLKHKGLQLSLPFFFNARVVSVSIGQGYY